MPSTFRYRDGRAVSPETRDRWISEFEAAMRRRYLIVSGESEEPNTRPGSDRFTDPVPKPIERDNDVIKVVNVDLDIAKNTKEHHTNEFEIADKLDGDSREFLVIRRGQKFTMSIDFNRDYDEKKDDLRIVFKFGKKPVPGKGTLVEILLSDRDVSNSWGAYIQSKRSKGINLVVTSPSTCAVGKWQMTIDIVKREEHTTSVYRYAHPDPVYILFNPWCEDDQVYFHEDKEKLLDEYVLMDVGKIYVGSHDSMSSNPWNFGQFSGNVLDCILYLLESSAMKDNARGDPVQVTRKLSALINDCDDNGVLSGNWSGDYSGGTSPLKWAGSVDILEEYYKTKRPVRYGQCWVFSGLLTTACRALGIPARSVTNFSSAHDTDGSITIDRYFDHKGKEIEYLRSDSVWNFHVWNDAWMARPDLPSGYGGWQAIDATPQEESDEIYRTGPMSLLAIKRGEVVYPYDGKFIFSEVNGDRVNWRLDENGDVTVTSVDEHAIGLKISTKKPFKNTPFWEYGRRGDPDREDVTSQYKYPDGSKEERAAVRRANLESGTSTKYKVYEAEAEDVTFDLRSVGDTRLGDTIKVTLKMTNTSKKDRSVNGTVTLSSMYYTGVVYKQIGQRSLEKEVIKPGEEKLVQVEIPVLDYLERLMDHCMCKISCMCLVDETKQVFSKLDILRLVKPHLDIKAPVSATVGDKFEVSVSFDNPLPVTLTDCELRVEGPGLQRPVTYKQSNVKAKEKFVGKFEMTPTKLGEREIIVYFNCSYIDSVTASHMMEIKSK